MPPITDYAFGKMTIKGTIYTRDLIIFPDGRIQTDWFRQSGHLLRQEDLDMVLPKGPELIIAGTGAYGRMAVAPGLEKALEKMKIRLVAMETPAAVALYNSKLSKNASGLCGCFHLTC
jgi:hypothetical protein